MSEDRNSYSSILKAIGLFGGVKIFQIVVGIVKNKCVALLLGPAGMGIVGMLSSTTGLISTFTGFGLSTSTVRDVSSAYASGDNRKVGRVVAILRKLIWATGLLGVFMTLILSGYLSLWAFGNYDYTNAFRILSCVLLFDQLTVGQTVLLQGTFHYKNMANAAVYGSVLGLVFSIPLYYVWGERAIVPVMIFSSLTALVLEYYYARKIKISKESVSFRDIMSEGKTMIVLGVVLAATSTFRLGGVYLKRLFISNIGTIADVGLFVAGSSIVTQYIDVILSSMSTDYTPRLAAISNDNGLFVETINRQMKLMVTIILPFIILFIILGRELIIILYSNQFLDIIRMIEWMMFGMFFKSISWCLSFAFVAKGASKVFFWNETICTVYSFAFSALGFYFARFLGLGVGFAMTNLLYAIQMVILARGNFAFRFSKGTIWVIIKQFLVLLPSFIIMEIMQYSLYRYLVGLSIMVVVSLICYKDFNEMIPIKTVIKSLIGKITNKH